MQLLMNRLGRCTTPIDLDYCTLEGAGSLGLRLCWICTSEEDKWLILWDCLHTRGRNGGSHWAKPRPLCPHARAHIAALALKLPEKPPCPSLPQFTCSPAALQMPTLYQVRWADASSKVQASRSMPTHFSHPVPHVLSPSIRLTVELSPTDNHVASGLAQLLRNQSSGELGWFGWGLWKRQAEESFLVSEEEDRNWPFSFSLCGWI